MLNLLPKQHKGTRVEEGNSCNMPAMFGLSSKVTLEILDGPEINFSS
jgi:hypothetical protein